MKLFCRHNYKVVNGIGVPSFSKYGSYDYNKTVYNLVCDKCGKVKKNVSKRDCMIQLAKQKSYK